ncbi:MAG: alternative ribosome rescue aminoacyl-tRNA hydrolase ArfB [Saprospiraceae bacterium]
MKEQSLAERLTDLEKEFSFRMSRSSGKGGQHVNKVSTRVELLFDVLNSEILTEKEKGLMIKNLAAIISQNGILQIASQNSRSQLRNKENAKAKFFERLEKALTVEKPRKKTRKPKSLNEKRLKEKKIIGEKKASRQKVNHKND